ncbi:MAG: PIG-L family deacetylase [Verrucomicrobiota bacterium]
MKSSNSPYLSYVDSIKELYNRAKQLDHQIKQPATGTPNPVTKANEGPSILLFSPHPDDECITGLLPLRLAQEKRARITNVAVTLGSLAERREERWDELQIACQHLNFQCHRLDLKDIVKIAQPNNSAWKDTIQSIQNLFTIYKPDGIFCPHPKDAHPTHQAVYQLILESIRLFPSFTDPLNLFYTEYWSTMEKPNLMIEASNAHLAELIYSLSCHRGEVNRNPYHLTLPAWMMDNTRRGSELLSKPGASHPDLCFSTLYKWQIIKNGTFCQPSSKMLKINTYCTEKSLEELF